MVLVDTSVWIDHFRHSVPDLVTLLEDDHVLVHPFIVGEIACGSLRQRRATISLLRLLPPAPIATDTEAFALLETEQLWGRGIGWVDLHLIASARLASASVWTRDRRLRAVCEHLAVDHLN